MPKEPKPAPGRAELERFIREAAREEVVAIMEPVLTEFRASLDELARQDQMLYGMIQGFQLGYQAAVAAQTGPRTEANPRPKPKPT